MFITLYSRQSHDIVCMSVTDEDDVSHMFKVGDT